jgi:hypothetical protein
MEIVGRLQIPDGSLAVNIPIVLNGGDYKTFSKIDGTFRFERVPSGTISKILFTFQMFNSLLSLQGFTHSMSFP